MKRKMKVMLKRAYILSNRLFFSIFYDRKYLKGKYFEDCITGWQWARRDFFSQIILGNNKQVPWPVNRDTHITGDLITFHPDDMNNFQGFGIYYQANYAHIIIGKGSYIAPNVGLITANHSVHDLDIHMSGKDIILGEKCWIGMNSVILPGVVLGAHTVVGAGSVVTKSFTDGWCVLAGAPAKVIRKITEDERVL